MFFNCDTIISMKANDVITELKKYATKERAATNKWFFKQDYTDKNDRFLGVCTPDFRRVAKQFSQLSFNEIEELLNSYWHEVRLTGLVILTHQFESGDQKTRKSIFNFYLKHTYAVNNWDLVDISAHKIVGQYIMGQKFELSRNIVIPLRKLSNSKNMWERRIAMVSTWMLIRAGELDQTYLLAEKFLSEEHDLMHKAVGWMLREAGKRDEKRLERFLKKHYTELPRTTLRYAIEKFQETKRKKLLRGDFS